MSHNSSIQFDSNLEDRRDDSGLFAVLVLFTSLISLSTTARIATKLWHSIRYGLSDLFILIALAFNLTGNILEFLSLRQGFGRHLQFLTRDQELTLLMLAQFTLLFAFISIWAAKLSVAFFILSIIRGTHQRTRWVCYGLIALTTAAQFAQVIIWALQARPIEKLWKPEIPGVVASLNVIADATYALTCINLATDIFFALLPLYVVWDLKMDRKKKMIIFALTSSGLLVVVAASVRLAYLKNYTNPDFSWYLPSAYIATIVERNLAEFIADMPVLYPMLRKAFEKTGHFLTILRRNDSKATHQPHSQKKSEGGRRTLVTIGSAGRQKPRDRYFLGLSSAGSEDQIYLHDIGPSLDEVEHESQGR
ncbi:hypothetical protein F4678DRAFT_464564 [Xylaria arbuscula]|nr:hypothetical protein F4678DRAFT_464564 [Xylaria arbuscula]